MKITVDFADSVLFVLEMAKEQLATIEYEVRECVQGTMYNDDDIADAKNNIESVEKYLNQFYA